MIIFVIYMATLFLFTFFVVGAMFASIFIFAKQMFATTLGHSPDFKHIWESGVAMQIFMYCYMILLLQCLLIALAHPLTKESSANVWFGVVTFVFSLLTLSTLFGIAVYLYSTGLYPEEEHYDLDSKEWIKQGNTSFSWLVLSGMIMIGVYIVPIILRPVDFCSHMCSYIMGLIAYLLLIPMYTNVFQIYGMSNLHDLSWGNRPDTKSKGTDAFTDKEAKAATIKMDYEAFRANFLYFWLLVNALYVVIIL